MCSVCLVSKPDSGLVFQDLKKIVSLNINNMALCKEVILIRCLHNKLLSAATTHTGDVNKIQGGKVLRVNQA